MIALSQLVLHIQTYTPDHFYTNQCIDPWRYNTQSFSSLYYVFLVILDIFLEQSSFCRWLGHTTGSWLQLGLFLLLLLIHRAKNTWRDEIAVSFLAHFTKFNDYVHLILYRISSLSGLFDKDKRYHNDHNIKRNKWTGILYATKNGKKIMISRNPHYREQCILCISCFIVYTCGPHLCELSPFFHGDAGWSEDWAEKYTSLRDSSSVFSASAHQ